MFKYLVFAITLLVSASGIQASTINEPGFNETLLANIPGATASFGSMSIAQDSSGDIYGVGSFFNEVIKVTQSGVVSQFGTTGVSGGALGIGIIGDTLYVGFDTGAIITMDLTLPSPTGVFLASIGSGNDAMGMAEAPAGFGAYAGQLVVGSYDGISIVNPLTGAVSVLLSTVGDPHSDVGFTPAGELLATDYNNNRIVMVSDSGTESVFYAGPTEPDGIAIHPGSGELYVASSGSDTIVKIAPDGSSSSVFATGADFDSGWFASPIRFSIDGTALYYGAGESQMDLYQISGFDPVGPPGPGPLLEAVPTTSAWALIVLAVLLGLMVFATRRRLFL